MKQFLSVFIIAEIITIPTINLATPIVPPFVMSQQQTKEETPTSIQLVFPDFALVSLKSGNMASGNFIDFNNRSLIIAFRGYTQGIPLTEIQSIEFKEKVLVPVNENIICQQRNNDCSPIYLGERNSEEQQILSNIPLTALSLFRGAKTALLTISDELLEDEQGQKPINTSHEIIHVIDYLEMEETGEIITIKMTPISRQSNLNN
ncbi:MAG: hypothetical protein WBM62_09720 [Crocosphaera sp.]